MKKKKLVHGVGVNDADYVVKVNETISCADGTLKKKLVWVCPYWNRWVSMLTRCYSEKSLKSRPTYDGCYVCEEWLTFSNFKTWMEQQDWEGKQLDKDVLFSGNKEYSPETCVFVDQAVNKFLLERDASRGEYPIGVYWGKQAGKFKAQCSSSGNRIHLGYFETELEAHKAWLAFKLEQAKILAAEQTDPRVAKALIERYENYSLLCY